MACAGRASYPQRSVTKALPLGGEGQLRSADRAVSEEECLSGGVVCGLCFTRRTRTLPPLTRTELRLFRDWWEMRPGPDVPAKREGEWAVSNGNSFGNSDLEPWYFRLMRPIRDRQNG
jgi:hypothetical protein